LIDDPREGILRYIGYGYLQAAPPRAMHPE